MTEFTLDDDQGQAVDTDAPALIVIAAAGCGKTEVVARRVERLLLKSASDPYRVLALSYTVRAADEMRVRFDAKLGDLRRRVDTETIHEFAFSLLRRYGTRIGLPVEPEVLSRDEDRVEFLDRWLRQLGRAPVDDARALLRMLDLARARREDAALLEEWKSALQAAGAVDYPAMLDCACELLTDDWLKGHLQSIYGHVIVDEAQNLTEAQYQLMRMLVGWPAAHRVHTALVGDARQSIVGFAGADPLLMRRFEEEYRAERVELRTNYRSARRIVAASRAVSDALGTPSVAGDIAAFAADGLVLSCSLPGEAEEAAFVAGEVREILTEGLSPAATSGNEPRGVKPEEVAVLARASATLLPVHDALLALGIPSASASGEDEWVASPAAKAIVEIVAYLSAPEHDSTQRHIARLCGVAEYAGGALGELLRRAADPDIVKLAELAEQADVTSLMEAAQGLAIDDLDWINDWRQIERAWNLFLDRSEAAERSFGNFRQHLIRCQRGDPKEPGVRLLTVHKAQGQEFKAVAVIGCNDGQFPDFRAVGEDAMAAEVRTFYVAISRPSRWLLLTRAESRVTRFGPRLTSESPFLELIRPAL